MERPIEYSATVVFEAIDGFVISFYFEKVYSIREALKRADTMLDESDMHGMNLRRIDMDEFVEFTFEKVTS